MPEQQFCFETMEEADMRNRAAVSVLALAALLAAAGAGAQSYPTKPIRVIVPFSAGGPNDVLARLVTPKITEKLGQPVVIENRGGLGGTIGIELLTKLPGDGYALGMGGSSNLTVAPSLYAKLGYDPQKDLTPIINVAAVPYALAVSDAVVCARRRVAAPQGRAARYEPDAGQRRPVRQKATSACRHAAP
jgi:tripartite-type tricarboxylate transporter receptor subunit TctC